MRLSVSLLVGFLAAPLPAQDTLVPVVSYDRVASEVQKHRGKVIVVDIWAEY
jgi:hypothetical protein